MYIGEIDIENNDILISSGNKKEYVACTMNEDGSGLKASYVRIVENTPVPGRKITIATAKNGYVISYKNNSSFSLYDISRDGIVSRINNFMNEDVESRRKLTEDEICDEDLLKAVNELAELRF